MGLKFSNKFNNNYISIPERNEFKVEDFSWKRAAGDQRMQLVLHEIATVWAHAFEEN